jgi:hypothetical protein
VAAVDSFKVSRFAFTGPTSYCQDDPMPLNADAQRVLDLMAEVVAHD